MKKFLINCLFVLAFIVIGCGDPLEDSRIVNTAVPAETTQIISGDSRDGVASVTDVEGKEIIVMSGHVSDYPIGGHLIFEDSEMTPGGRLVKTESVLDNRDGTVSLTCSNGLLEDALKDASVSFSGVLTTKDVISVESRVIDARAISFTDTFEIDLEKVDLVEKIKEWAISDFGNSSVDATDILKLNIGGKIKLRPSINLDLQIEKFKTKYALFDVGADIKTDLLISGGLDQDWKFDIPLFTLNYGVITIMAGPVPIIFQPQFDIMLHVRGEVESSVSMQVSQQTRLRVCAEKIGEADWNTENSEAYFSVPQFDEVYPKIKVSGGISVSESAGLVLYGVLGVVVSIDEFVDFSANILEGEGIFGPGYALKNWADLYVGDYLFESGVGADVSLRVSAFGFVNKDFSVWGDHWVLARWKMNQETGYEKNAETGMYGVWDFPAIQYLIK